MADVFISWGTPDGDAVGPLVRWLKDVGADCFEYTDEMRAGPIAEQVLEEIHRARLALFCMSDETVTREWFRRELDWCYSDERDSGRPMKSLILTRVGPLNVDGLPNLIRGRYVYDFTAPASYEKTFNRLVKDIQAKLGYREPMVVPATVFAMTSDESPDLLQFGDQLDQVTGLYRRAGIGHEEDWAGSFPSRYDDTPEAFAPFSDKETIKGLVHAVLRQINQGRRKAAPISIQWYHRHLLVAETEEGDRARNEWRNDCHMLIVDAVSLLIKSIADDLVTVLSLTRNEMRRALVWIPPYTRHAGHLQDLITRIEKPTPLRTLLQDWQTRPECCLTFDTATNVSLSRWLNHALRDLAAPPPPLADNLADLERTAGKVAITPANMHATAGSEY